MNRSLAARARAAGLFALSAVLALFAAPAPTPAQTASGAVVDSLSPVFRGDSTNLKNIRAVEAGVAGADSARSIARTDSLRRKLEGRGPYIGLSVGAAFGEHSARARFQNAMTLQASNAGQRILQSQDPVHVFFPVGLVVGIPVFSHLDLTVRTEHFYYRMAGLAQKDNEAATEFWYVNQGHLAGVGARWHVPLSLLTVSGQSGLYFGYTHLWNFGPTGIRSPDGSIAATFNPAGAGMELQAGFQQDFDKRWALTGGFAWSRLAFTSEGDWTNVAAASSAPGEKAEWTLNSLRFAMQGVYQFGRKGK